MSTGLPDLVDSVSVQFEMHEEAFESRRQRM